MRCSSDRSFYVFCRSFRTTHVCGTHMTHTYERRIQFNMLTSWGICYICPFRAHTALACVRLICVLVDIRSLYAFVDIIQIEHSTHFCVAAMFFSLLLWIKWFAREKKQVPTLFYLSRNSLNHFSFLIYHFFVSFHQFNKTSKIECEPLSQRKIREKQKKVINSCHYDDVKVKWSEIESKHKCLSNWSKLVTVCECWMNGTRIIHIEVKRIS